MFALLFIVSNIMAVSIDQFKSRPGDTSLEAALANSFAITAAILAANASLSDRTAVIPEGEIYYIFPVSLTGIYDVTVEIRGTVSALDDISNWPTAENGARYLDIFYFGDSHYLTIKGFGTIDGRGYRWWEKAIFDSKHFNDRYGERPRLLMIESSSYITIQGLTFIDSPFYHVVLQDVVNAHVTDFKIKVDITSQKSLFHKHDLLDDLGIPLFPLNTDGVDPAGKNITISNCFIENYDDAVAVKPLQQSDKLAKCSEDILIQNCSVSFGVGMTVGSVPPSLSVNCVNNVTFRDISFKTPFKAIYIKTNPGYEGSGIISNIRYENIDIESPVWWAIYIGPQQQKQPDGEGPGCFLYPLGKCETQPRVPMRNVTLSNVRIRNGLLSPGIIRCNETNPCTGFVFDNVRGDGWMSSTPFICENIQGIAVDSSPAPGCLVTISDV